MSEETRGLAPRWTSSAKSGIGTSLSAQSRVWVTLSHGIWNEVYYRRTDEACIRDLGLIVTDGGGYFSEEKRHARPEIEMLEEGIPAFRLTNTSLDGRYRIEKEIITDPRRDVVLQRTRFVPLVGDFSTYHLYVLLAPHLKNHGAGNNAWVGDYKGVPMLLAERDGNALALACSAPWLARSAGYVGYTDGWQDLSRHHKLTWLSPRADDGNVALTGEIDLRECGGEFTLALGFGGNPAEAGQLARASLLDGFDSALEEYLEGWRSWQKGIPRPGPADRGRSKLYWTSAAVLRIHEEKRFPGGVVASLSIPWGASKGDDDLGGYHLIWPRDLVEAAGGLLAIGALEDARRVLDYLQITQEADGSWPQNMWLDGTPYWTGIQMDETAFPILLADLARRSGALPDGDIARVWPMVRLAAQFIVNNGPVTQEDRWEEDPGYSPFTLAVEIAALVVAADFADVSGEPGIARYLRETADVWNSSIERWTYDPGSDLAKGVGVEGYYVRIAPVDAAEAASPLQGFVPIKNRPPGASEFPAAHIVSADALALVRFGLRAPDDPRILDTVRVIDSLLKVDLPAGPAWRRYNEDGYGEHADGSPFDGTGIGRAWPLLTGERAHFELAAGRPEVAERLLQTMEAFAGVGGLIPEQVWDGPDIPEIELQLGRPSGSAMPLVWAHAEHLKLCRSLRDGRVFDAPPQTVQRYLVDKVESPHAIWRPNQKSRTVPVGKTLRIELPMPTQIDWTVDAWRSSRETPTRDTGLGVHLADLPTAALPPGTSVEFRFRPLSSGTVEGITYTVTVKD